MNRRAFLCQPIAAFAQAPAIRRSVFLPSPGKGTAVLAYAFYTRHTGGEMMSLEQRMSRSDTVDVAYYRSSRDHGATWTAPVERKTGEKQPGGMLRRHIRAAYADPKLRHLIEFWNEGILPNDDPLEGLRQWNVYYKIAGKTHQVIHKGSEFDERHPLPGVFTGKNCVMLGDVSQEPLTLKDGTLLVPAGVSLIDKDGKLANPGGGYTYTDAVVLIGRWKGSDYEWEMSQRVEGDPARSTRGMVEPTLGELTRGRLLMVVRGSNDRKLELPGYRWFSISSDAGRTWTTPQPWTFHDGSSFYSPSACSQLLSHSNGKLYWLGNISRENPRGNRPRFPFYIGEVDRDSGKLIRDSLRVIDDRRPDESDILSLSNFFAREDRKHGGITLHMTRLFALQDGWEGDAMMYSIPV